MALTRPKVKEILSGAGVDEENIEQAVSAIIAGHTASIDALKEERDTYKASADKLSAVEQELEKLKADAAKDNPFEKKYADVKAEYDKYRADVEARETKAAKEAAVKAYLESKNIKGNNLKLAMKAAKDEINAVEIADGKIKDTAAIDSLIQGDFSSLVSTEQTVGATVATPPQNNGGSTKVESRAAKLAAQYHSNLYGGNGSPNGQKGE